MPIKIDSNLPAHKLLENENVFVMTEERAVSQDIRPLKILILNLMPTKIETELLQTATHEVKNVSKEHMFKFYKTFNEIKDERFDGMVVTGAPVENMEFEQVDYWDELCRIFEWSKTNVYSSFFICWGAQAALYYKYGLRKYRLDRKMFGVFEHVSLDNFHPLMRGLDDKFWVPHSRHTEVRRGDIALIKDLQILSYSEKAGVHLLSDMECRNFFSTGHSEYDRDTLAKEYFRDAEKGLDIDLPENYFPDNDPAKTPEVKWRGAANIIFSNWLNYFVYQRTPYDLSTL